MQKYIRGRLYPGYSKCYYNRQKFLRNYKMWMTITHMMGTDFNDDYNDEIIPLLPFPPIPSLN